jgi:hypothetical protein
MPLKISLNSSLSMTCIENAVDPSILARKNNSEKCVFFKKNALKPGLKTIWEMGFCQNTGNRSTPGFSRKV